MSRFNFQFNKNGIKKTSLDYSNTKEKIYVELAPHAVDLQTGEVLNPNNFPIFAENGEVDVQQRIDSFADECDLYSILGRFAQSGCTDTTLIHKSIGSFADVMNIPDNINDFGEYLSKNLSELKKADPAIAQAVISNNMSNAELQTIIENSVKSAIIAQQNTKKTDEGGTE